VKTIDIEQPWTLTIGQNLRGLIVEMRPQEWTKNLLVFSGVIFSKSLTDISNLWISLAGFALFCCASSCIYLLNDLCDLQADREHPVKQNRPLASGVLNINVARVAVFVLFLTATIGSFALNRSFALVVALYLLICIAYSLKLKDVVILDVIIIASGFVLRAVSGAVLISVAPSEWLVLCT
jgi:4-hydroxybenzoate polyprenyltransferase